MRTSLLLCVNKVRCKNMNVKTNKDRKSDVKDRTITRQAKEIESLKTEISKLEAACEEKDAVVEAKENEAAEFTASVEFLREELKKNIDELKVKGKEYDELNADLRQMRKVFAKDVFNGEWRWRIIKWLMK